MNLREASEAEQEARDVATYEAWGSSLSLEQWRIRERRLRSHPWSREAMKGWLWCGAQGEVLASCETFQMASLLDGVRSGSFGVASVYTEPSLRRRGYASSMLRALVERIRRTSPRAHAVFLFSDAGAAIYQRVGFVPRPGVDWVLPPIDAEPSTGVDQLIREEGLAAALSSLPPPRDAYAVAPSAAQLDWHIERERIYARALGRLRPPAVGARAGDAVALWAGVLRSEELVVLLARGQGAELARVLGAAQRCAGTAGLKRVRIWDTPELPLSAVPGIQRTEREGALPMIQPLASFPASAWRTIPRALWV